MSYRPLVHNYRVHGQIRRWLVEARVGSLAVIPHWGNLGWAAAAAANALNIPVGSTPSVSVAGNSASIVGWNRMDVIGCYGLQCQDAFASQGYFPDRLRLTGSVALDEVLHVSREQARGRLKAFGRMAAAGRRIVLYATSGANKNEREILTRIVEFCGEPSSEASLVVRPHQAIGSAFYEEAVAAAVGQRRQEFATVISEGTAHENILAADIVITDFSTVGAEAVLIGRPLLTINTTGTPFPANNYADLGVAAGAHTLDEIGPALRRLAEEGAFWRNARESLEAFIKAYNWGGDGQASTRFLAELERLAQRAEAPALQPVGALPLPSKRD
jgi:UDP-N-acetylglucosamine 2-epimerase